MGGGRGAGEGGGENVNALSSLAKEKEKMLIWVLKWHMFGHPNVCTGVSLNSEFQELIETWLY